MTKINESPEVSESPLEHTLVNVEWVLSRLISDVTDRLHLLRNTF